MNGVKSPTGYHKNTDNNIPHTMPAHRCLRPSNKNPLFDLEICDKKDDDRTLAETARQKCQKMFKNVISDFRGVNEDANVIAA